MVNFTFRGLVAPTLTPFKSDLSIDTSVIQEYCKFLADAKILAILVNGSSGEGTSMNIKERKFVAEAWLKAAKNTKQHVMIQVGGVPLPDVLELAKHAEDNGADSLLCLPELYNSPTNAEELINYLKIVGAAAPKTPLLYYHIPCNTNVNIHMGDFLNRAVGRIPTLKGIKFTSTDLEEGMAALKANGGKYAVFLGSDQLMASAFTVGFDSAIGTSLNMVPQLGNAILEAVQKSDLQKARKIQNILTEFCSSVSKNGRWVPTMKVAMEILTPIQVGKARPPLSNLNQDQIDEMKKDLKVLELKK